MEAHLYRCSSANRRQNYRCTYEAVHSVLFTWIFLCTSSAAVNLCDAFVFVWFHIKFLLQPWKFKLQFSGQGQKFIQCSVLLLYWTEIKLVNLLMSHLLCFFEIGKNENTLNNFCAQSTLFRLAYLEFPRKTCVRNALIKLCKSWCCSSVQQYPEPQSP